MATQYDIIGGIVDPKVYAELDKLKQYAEDINATFKQISVGNTGGSDNSDAKFAKLQAQAEKMQLQNEKLAKQIELLEMRKQAAIEATNRKMEQSQARQQAADAKTIGYINNLTAEVKQLTSAYAQLSKAELDDATIGGAQLKQLTEKREELRKLKSAYGDNTMNVGNYSSATKMLGINIGQVMKEMPNFAISARIGIMSLTNNLPILAESIAAVRKELQMLIAQGQKAPSMFGMIIRSVFSLTGIMSIAMVLFQLFGEDIIKWVENLFKAKEITDKFSYSQSQLNHVLTEQSGSAKSAIEHIKLLGFNIEKYGNDSKYAKNIIEDFNKTFHTHVNTMDEVRKLYPEVAKAAIDSAIKQQAAIELISKASSSLMSKMRAENVLTQFSPQQIDEATKRFDKFFDGLRNKLKESGYNKDQITEVINNTAQEISSGKSSGFDWAKIGMGVFNSKSKDIKHWLKNEEMDLYKIMDDFGSGVGQKMFSAIFDIRRFSIQEKGFSADIKKLLQEPESQVKTTKSGSSYTPTATKIDAKAEYYDPMREAVIKQMSDLELRMAKETTDGIKNSYEDRASAAADYYATVRMLAKIDLDTKIFSLKEELRVAKASAEEKNANNQKKKLTPEEKLKSEQELATTLATLNNNFLNDKLKAEDDYRKKSLDGELKYKKDILAITKDRIAENIRLIDAENAVKLSMIEQQQKEAEIKANTPTGLRVLEQGLGLNVDRSFEASATKQMNTEKSLNRKIADNQAKQNIPGISQEEKTKLQEEQFNLTKELVDSQANYELESTQKVQEKKVELVSKSIDAIAKLNNQFFENYYKQLDKQAKKFGKIEDEKQKTIDDKLKAGVISQQEADDQKAISAAYYQSQLEEIERKKAEAEKTKFFVDQGMALAKIAWETSVGAITYGANPVTAPLVPWVIGLGALQAALVLAATIPQFATGGEMDHDGMAILGDGGKNELFMMPSGKWGISPDVPTPMYLEKGTKILPDVNKIDLTSMLAMAHAMPNNYDMSRLEMQLKTLNKTVSSQRPAQLRGMKLINQMQYADRISRRNKSMMN